MEVPARIEVEDEELVILEWEDGSVDEFSAAELRAACQCASCREPAGARRTEAVLAGDEPVRITEAGLVGAYALQFHFSPDDHHTGIYSFEALRGLRDDD